MKSISLFKNRNTYSSIVLILVLVSEAIVITGLKYQIQEMTIWPLAILAPIFMLVLIGWFYGKYEFWPQSTIFTKLMANAIAPSWWGAFYLLFFVIHIGWLTNGSFDLFKSSNLDTKDVVVLLIVGSIGLFILICFFPDGKIDKRKAKKVVLISGISKLQPTIPFEKLNLSPLVSILDLTFKKNDEGKTEIDFSDISKMLILNSNIHEDNAFALPKVEIDITKNHEYSDKVNLLKDLFPTGEIFYNEKTEPIRMIVKLGDSCYKTPIKTVEEKLRRSIKDAALLIYPEESERIESLKIEFTNYCDYDNFEQCFDTLQDAIKKEDNNEQRLFFNLTPGTGIVGSLMTLFSIDKDRELFFYAQMTSKLLKPVHKSRLPLENLLSQALEKIKEQKN